MKKKAEKKKIVKKVMKKAKGAKKKGY